jgi:hypothetical protein
MPIKVESRETDCIVSSTSDAFSSQHVPHRELKTTLIIMGVSESEADYAVQQIEKIPIVYVHGLNTWPADQHEWIIREHGMGNCGLTKRQREG